MGFLWDSIMFSCSQFRGLYPTHNGKPLYKDMYNFNADLCVFCFQVKFLTTFETLPRGVFHARLVSDIH